MKKFSFILMALFLVFIVNAQEENNDETKEKETEGLVSKKGVPILPEAGEYSIGINAAPFLNYFGNVLNGTAGNIAPAWGFTAQQPTEIYGKYMVDENTAYRGVFRIGFASIKDKEYVIQDGQTNPDPTVTVEDVLTQSGINIGLGVGLEKRRGKGRLKGIYGAMAMITFSNLKNKYEYGNAFSTKDNNNTPTVWDWSSNSQTNVSSRKLEEKGGATIGFYAYGFVGAEYFFAPKISLSGEFMYGLFFERTGDQKTTLEYYGIAPGQSSASLNTMELKKAGKTIFGLDNNVAATLNLNFYF